MSQEYNGWTNYETWLVNLWLTNEEWSAEELRSIANNGQRRDYRKEELKSYVEDEMLALHKLNGLASDLIGSALSMVNWYEILDHATEMDEQYSKPQYREE